MKQPNPNVIQLQFRFYPFIAMLFVFCFIISNILATKVTRIWHFDMPAGVITFPLSYIFSDVLTEVYGFQRARQLVWMAITCNALFVVFATIAIHLPTAPGWFLQQQDFTRVFSYEPRLLLASSLAYFAGDYANCSVLAKLKLRNKSRFIWARFIGSSAIGVAIDNTIFSLVAFAGTLPLAMILNMILSQYLFKLGYEVVMSPLSVRFSRWLKRAEQTDIYDYQTRFNPLDLRISYSAADNHYSMNNIDKTK